MLKIKNLKNWILYRVDWDRALISEKQVLEAKFVIDPALTFPSSQNISFAHISYSDTDSIALRSNKFP